MAVMARTASLPADPFASTDWLLIDGTNLLHALAKSKVAAPRSALIGRIRGIVPTSVAIDVVFDGPSEPGLRGERIASGLRVRYSGGRTADAVLLSLVDETRVSDGPLGTAAILVVTDDRDLRHGLQNRGARTAGTAWLLGRLERTGRSRDGSSLGQAPKTMPAATGSGTAAGSAGDRDTEDEGRWEPGRRATVKKGNARRRPRHHPGRNG